jgi:acyl-coenzyme A synthetase/AMP-(fatty) acid ligase
MDVSLHVKNGTANNALLGAESKVKNAICARWRDVVTRKAAAPAIFTTDGRTVRTFAEIESESGKVATRLAKFPPGAVVSLQAPNRPAWPELLLGIWKAGHCALLVDHSLGVESRDAAERVCGAQVRLGLDVDDQPLLERLEHAAVNFGVGCRSDAIKLTSGTTGAPRAVLFTAAQLEADCDQVCETMGIGEDDVNYGVVAFSHSYGFSNLVTPLLCRGVPLVAAEDALPRAILAGIANSGATVLPAVPAIFQALSGVDGDMPALRLCISAGAPLRTSTAGAFRARFGRKVHTFYGASECGGICYDGDEDECDVPGFVGHPMRGVRIEPLEGGEIRVHSAAVGLGSFPLSPEEDLGGGVFRPSDLLEATAAGWRITGRRTDIINVGGKKVSPAEVEGVLLAHPAVREAVVFGTNAEARTQAVCACVVVEGEVSEAELRAYCASRLATWQVPRDITRLDALPVNTRGKINRRELVERFG